MSKELDPTIVLAIAGEVTRVVTRREHPVEIAVRIVADLTAGRRLADDHHQPLIALTADEVAAVIVAVKQQAQHADAAWWSDGASAALRSALDKLTTEVAE